MNIKIDSQNFHEFPVALSIKTATQRQTGSTSWFFVGTFLLLQNHEPNLIHCNRMCISMDPLLRKYWFGTIILERNFHSDEHTSLLSKFHTVFMPKKIKFV